jgi:nucleoside phosphorylase
LVQLAHIVAAHSWYIVNDRPPLQQPKAMPAVFASGEQVLASTAENAVVFQQIKRAYDDSQIVDMEAYGFLHACRAEKVPHCMVIRGVGCSTASEVMERRARSLLV